MRQRSGREREEANENLQLVSPEEKTNGGTPRCGALGIDTPDDVGRYPRSQSCYAGPVSLATSPEEVRSERPPPIHPSQ